MTIRSNSLVLVSALLATGCSQRYVRYYYGPLVNINDSAILTVPGDLKLLELEGPKTHWRALNDLVGSLNANVGTIQVLPGKYRVRVKGFIAIPGNLFKDSLPVREATVEYKAGHQYAARIGDLRLSGGVLGRSVEDWAVAFDEVPFEQLVAAQGDRSFPMMWINGKTQEMNRPVFVKEVSTK